MPRSTLTAFERQSSRSDLGIRERGTENEPMATDTNEASTSSAKGDMIVQIEVTNRERFLNDYVPPTAKTIDSTEAAHSSARIRPKCSKTSGIAPGPSSCSSRGVLNTGRVSINRNWPLRDRCFVETHIVEGVVYTR